MTIPPHIQQAILAYYAERATDDDIAALEDWFRADEAHLRIFAEHGMVEWQILGEQEKADASAILATLREAEDNAEPDSLLNTPDFVPSGDDIIQALSELARHRQEGLKQPIKLTRRRKQRGQHSEAGQADTRRFSTRTIAAGSLAAAILLAGLSVLIVNWFAAPDQPVAEQFEESIIVATLTDATDAVWVDQAGEVVDLPLNSPMTQGQHLTLTEGMAELTTNRGAIALLEAPATIELIDSPNAVRLHAGKLVGICETESSKGFLVRTPHMDITDLGTRFGVRVDPKGKTAADVFEGSIRIQTPDADEPVVLIADQGVVKEPKTPTQRHSTPNLAGDYQKMLAMFDNTPVVTGAGLYLREAPVDVRPSKHRSGEAIIVFNEQAGLAWSGELLPRERVGQGPAKDQRVDTYLLHFDPPIIEIKGGNVKQFERQVVIDFDRPILGVISGGKRLYETDTALGSKATRYPVMSDQKQNSSRGLDAVKGNVPEGYSLSKDRQTLTAKMTAGRYFDQIRVIVEAASPE